MKNNIFTGVINILGKDIQARLVEQDIYSFGETSQREVVRLEGMEAKAFMNAVGDVKKDDYAILERGFHSHLSWDAVEDSGDKEMQAYVNFKKLKNQDTIKRLADMGITERTDRQGWLILNVKGEQFVPHHYAAPKLTRELYAQYLPEDFEILSDDDKKVAISTAAQQVHPARFKDNDTEWAVVHKQVALDHLLKVVAGTRRIVCYGRAKNWETLAPTIEAKFRLLFGENEVWAEDRAAKIQRFHNNLATKTGGYYVSQYPELEARIDEIVQTEGLIVFVNGVAKEMNPVDLIRKRIELKMNGGASTNNFRFPRTVEEVKGVIGFARANNWGLFLNS